MLSSVWAPSLVERLLLGPMAKTKLTGLTEEELERRKEVYYEHNDYEDEPFQDCFCLAKIPNQPPDYDGPVRYCMNSRVQKIGNSYRCKFHGGAGHGNPDKFEKLAAMTHGMYATQEHLKEEFTEKDEALYMWIMQEWPDAYGIDFDEDPAALHDMHRLAVEIVRAERGRGHVLKEGEVHETDVVGEEGVVLDKNGEVKTEKSEHYLAQMLHRQDKKLTQLEKELGITRKEQMRQDSTDSAVEAIQGLAELGSAFLDRENTDYDPDNKPWTENNGENS